MKHAADWRESIPFMVLTLEVIGEHAKSLGADSRKVFDRIGGTIGRLPDNDWVIADRYVSNRHALIRYVGGKYFIEDTSSNGVFVNSTANRLARDDRHQLRDGDLLYIDQYEIRVSLAAAPRDRNDPLARLRRDATSAPPRRLEPRASAPNNPPAVGRKAGDAEHDDTHWFGSGDITHALDADNASVTVPQPASPEVRDHQSAMDAALRAAFDALLARFAPERLELEFDRQLQKGAAPVERPAQWGELYRKWHAALLADADAIYAALFAREFAKEYDKQLRRLRSRRGA